MDLNAKPPSNTKAAENPKSQPPNWSVELDREINAGLFDTPGGSGCSGSELIHGYTSKSSKSASISSSPNTDNSKPCIFAFETSQDDSNGKIELSKEDIESSHAPELSSVSGEPLLTPKLGKRMYFEAVCPESDSKNLSFSRDLNSSLSIRKKCKSTGQNLQCPPCCQVEGCGLDLSSAKDYYRKHRVCDRHSKSLKVVIDGLERRFCQKCSRFHDLFEFDEKKKSCRRRLLHHNARGRLLHQDDSDGKIELSKEDIESSHAPELSSVSGEQVLTPKLGKRMYFEAVCPESDSKNVSFSRDLNSSLSIPKKCKSTGQNLQCPPRCQVEGCGLDLSSAKDYYRKHRVCDRHSKSLKVVIDGLECRFCQKCSRFHDLFEFDENKRSCRRNLLHHNARRRIYRPEAVQSSESALSSSRCHGKQQKSPFAYSRTATSLACQNIHNSKLPQTKKFLLKPAKVNIDTSSNVTTLSDDSRVLATKIINTGVEDFITFSDANATQDFTCAPSLLSTKPWDSYETQSISQEHSNSPTSALQAITPAIGEHMPLASSESWHSDHDQYVNSCMWISNSNCEDTNHFLEF